MPVTMQAARFQPVKPAMPVLTCSIFPKEGKYDVLKYKTLVKKTRGVKKWVFLHIAAEHLFPKESS